MRKHLVDSHEQLARHFARCCGTHKEMAAAHAARSADLSEGSEKTYHDAMHKCHGGMAKSCSDQADFHVRKAIEASTMEIGSGDVHVGDIHGPKVAKLALGEERFNNVIPDGVFLVPRTGSPTEEEINKAADGGEVPDSVKHIFQRRAAGGQ
jgi:hypothetical protein